MNTRHFLPIAAAAAALFCASAAQADSTQRTVSRTPVAKHIIVLVGDGMNIEHEIAASRYLSGRALDLSFHKLPYQGVQAHWDVSAYKKRGGTYDPLAIDALIGYDPAQGGAKPYPLGPELPGAKDYHLIAATDSASASTAWSTGYKTDDGNLAWLPGDPDAGGNRNGDGSLKSITEYLREAKGYAIGVVSTVPFTHATPAGFVSHNKSRNNYGAIGTEILQVSKPEVVIGGGHPGTDGSPTYNYIAESDYLDLKNGAHSGDYVFVERAAGVDGSQSLLAAAQQAVAEGKKLFGLFGKEKDGNFESLEPQDLPGTPLVKRATTENPTYAEATVAALQVLAQDKDGFFLMSEQGDIDWANHANDYKRMVGTIADLHEGVKAVVDFVDRPGDRITWDNTLLIVTSDHSNNYMRLQKRMRAGDLPTQTADCTGSACYPDGEVSFGSTGHTNELTRIYARGRGTDLLRKAEGRWYPGTRIVDNTQLFHVMMEAAGVPVEPALKLAE